VYWLRVSRNGAEFHHFVVALVAIEIGRVAGTSRLDGVPRVGLYRRGTTPVGVLVSGRDEAIVAVGQEAQVAGRRFGRHGEGSNRVSRWAGGGEESVAEPPVGATVLSTIKTGPCPSGDPRWPGLWSLGLAPNGLSKSCCCCRDAAGELLVAPDCRTRGVSRSGLGVQMGVGTRGSGSRRWDRGPELVVRGRGEQDVSARPLERGWRPTCSTGTGLLREAAASDIIKYYRREQTVLGGWHCYRRETTTRRPGATSAQSV